MKNNFDDILKRKLEQQHFPVDDTHRQEMVDLLDNQKRRRGFPFWWLGGLVFVIAFAGLYVINTSKVSDEKTNQPDPNEAKSSARIGRQAIALVDPIKEQQLNEISSRKNQIDENKIANNATYSDQQIGSVVSEKNQNLTKPKNQSIENSLIQNESDEFVSERNNETNSINDLIVEQDDVDSKENDSDLQLVSNPDDNTEIRDIGLDEASAFDDFSKARIINPLEDIESLEIKDLSYVSTPSIKQIEPASTFRKSLFVFGEAGVGLVLGSKPDYEAGWKLRAGAGLGYRLSSKVQLTLSGGYLYQNGGFDFQRLSAVNQPGFGARSSFNSLTPEKLHFVYSKLGVQVRSHRHVFGAHSGVQYLYGAQGNITTQVQDQFAPGTIETSKYSWLKTSGLRKIHWTADLSYGYQITPRLSITAGADYYFSSFTVEDPSLEEEGFTWSGAYSPFQPFVNINYLFYGRL